MARVRVVFGCAPPAPEYSHRLCWLCAALGTDELLGPQRLGPRNLCIPGLMDDAILFVLTVGLMVVHGIYGATSRRSETRIGLAPKEIASPMWGVSEARVGSKHLFESFL